METLTKTGNFWEYFNHLIIKKQLHAGDDFRFELNESLNNIVFDKAKKTLVIKHLMHVIDKVNNYVDTLTTLEDLVNSPYFISKTEGLYYFDVNLLQETERVRLLMPIKPIKTKIEFVDCLQTIDKVTGIIKNREVAINAYPMAKTYPEQADAISRLNTKLAELTILSTDVQKARVMLRMELDLHFIAPRTTIKIFTTYLEKVNAVMTLLREVLGLQKQF